jgi:predicted amidohydrolase
MCAVRLAGAGDAVLGPLTESQLKWRSVRVAAVQCLPERDKDPADLVVRYIEKAAGDEAQLVVFPEYHLGKIRIPCESTDKVAAAATKHHIYVIVGCFEILNDEGDYANHALLFDRAGKIIGRFAKVHPAVGSPPYFWPPHPDDGEWLMEAGTRWPVFDLDFGRIGILTCYDGYFPESFRCLALNGAEILVWINGRGGTIEDYIVQTAMHHNVVHMICTNQAMGSGTMIAEYPTHIKARCNEVKEDYVVADLNMYNVRVSRKHSRTYHQRKPEVYGPIAKSVPVYDAYVGLEDPEPQISLWANVVDEPKHRREGMKDGDPLSRISFRIHASWMHTPIELRFPEVLRSSMGFHFLDHYRETIVPLSEFEMFPKWQWNRDTGELSYEYETKEGLAFSGRAIPNGDEVALELHCTNNTGRTISHVEPNCCLYIGTALDFAHKWDLEPLYMFFDGKLQSLADTTPTPEQKGRDPWLLMLTPEGAKAWPEGDDSDTWWLVDQRAELNLLAAESKDGRHLVGYTWDQPAMTLMMNGGHPCFHTGPAPSPELKPGESHAWHGKVYLMENHKNELLRRYRADHEKWRKSGDATAEM